MKKRTIGITALSVVALTIFTLGAVMQTDIKTAIQKNNGKAKSVILFVGDGMGSAHRDTIRLATVGQNGTLAMDNMPYVGIVHTGSSNSLVTDSAAAATALATGVKSYNGAVGVDANGNTVKTILENAKESGKSTGLVTTSQVTDATPGAFGAHVADRSAQSDIAKQFLEDSKVDVILGGGEDYWYPAGNAGAFPDHPSEDTLGASNGSNGNLVEKAQKLGYTYVTNTEELKKAKTQKILGLFANEEMFQEAIEGKEGIYNPTVSLPDMTGKAIDILSKNKNGFFLMVEEEGIDGMAHNNNASQLIKAGQQLDKAVALAKEYAKRHPDTLVLVTGDHETGGLSLEDIEGDDESSDSISKENGPFNIANSTQQFNVDWTTSDHTSADVPLTAVGRGADLFSGIYENTYIYDAIKKVLGLK